MIYKGGIWLIKKSDLKTAQDRLISKVSELEYKLEASEKTMNILNSAISNQQQLITKLLANKDKEKHVSVGVSNKPAKKDMAKKKTTDIVTVTTLKRKKLDFVHVVHYKTETRIYGSVLNAFKGKRVFIEENGPEITMYENDSGYKVYEMSKTSCKLYMPTSAFSDDLCKGFHKVKRNADGSITIISNVLYDPSGKEIYI